MLDLVMKGEITAETDISVSPPDHTKPDGRATILALPEKSRWRGGQLERIIYLPGSSIRGALRNGAARAVATARAKGKSALTPEDYLLIAKGGIMDRKQAGQDERVIDYQVIATLRQEQPIVSLFGAMERKIAGRWQIGDAMPVDPTEPVRKGRGVRSHPFQRQPDLTAVMDQDAYQQFQIGDKKRVEANLVEHEAERLQRDIRNERNRPEPDTTRIDQWEKERRDLMERAKTLSAEAGGMVNIQQLLGGWEAIPEGTRMDHRMRIRGADADELAVAFFALRQLAREGRIGAHESRGEGYFTATYDLSLAEDDGDFQPAGRLTLGGLQLHLKTGNAQLRAAFERSASILDKLAGAPA